MKNRNRDSEELEAAAGGDEEAFALPLYAVFDANGKPVSTFPGLTGNADEFLIFYDKSD